MEAEVNKFKNLIEESSRILITSHTSPDPDALASLLLMGTTMMLNFPDKKVVMVLEEQPSGLDFLNNYQQIKFAPLNEQVNHFTPDLFIIVDANSYRRVSRT